MKPLTALRRSLGWKLFLSYLLIVVVAVAVLTGTANFHTSTALNHHIAEMQDALHRGPDAAADLDASLHAALDEIITVGALVAIVAAVLVSIFTVRRIVTPLQAMIAGSKGIAGGDYHQRVPVASQDELGVLAQAFNQMATALEQTDRRRLELIGTVAHELRTPLSSIRGVMEGLVDGVLPPEPATFLGVQHEVARLQRLVHDLEELSRADADQIPLNCRATDVVELVSPAVERLRPQFEDKGVTLTVDAPAGLPIAWADPGRITQVLLNLLGNALQYTPAGGQVSLRAWREDNSLQIAVQDTGIGIEPQHLAHIFERFFRVDKSRSRAGGGSGIGLTISRRLIEAHGGRLWAASPGVGQGSTFTVSLPFAP
jgi:histidine kinase